MGLSYGERGAYGGEGMVAEPPKVDDDVYLSLIHI